MDETSIPVLPHLPAVESWRESTQLAALRRSPRLQSLDDALETYENSFRRYSVISQAYYLKLTACHDEAGLTTGLPFQSARELAESAYSRAVHDFEAVEIAFSTWISGEEGALAVPEVLQLQRLLGAGRSRLSAQSGQVEAPQRRGERSTVLDSSPEEGTSKGRRHTLTPRR